LLLYENQCNSNSTLIKKGKFLDLEEQENHATLLQEYYEIFAWNYLDMLEINPKIVTHNIVLEENAKLVRQKI
jgi:succinyl-CoA synthetase beta subunit